MPWVLGSRPVFLLNQRENPVHVAWIPENGLVLDAHDAAAELMEGSVCFWGGAAVCWGEGRK